MASFEHGNATIHYDLSGDGFPVLLIAPGGMRSANEIWAGTPWDPNEHLSGDYRVIGMDQRNAGRSTAPISADDGWATYTADQLALLDHLGVEQCHVVGMCIGGPYIMALLLAAPERFASAVLLQPVGLDDNRHAFDEMFGQWADSKADSHPAVTPEAFASFNNNMWDGEFVLTATRAQVAACSTPMLVLMGNDLYHPESTSREIASLAPHARLIEEWKDGDALVSADSSIKRFLADHTPA